MKLMLKSAGPVVLSRSHCSSCRGTEANPQSPARTVVIGYRCSGCERLTSVGKSKKG